MPSYSHYIDSLLQWGKRNCRAFPWRKDISPYRILVAEFLLQKTNSEKAVRAYEMVMQQFPDVRSLANALPGELAKCIEGIGLRYRTDRMTAAARAIVSEFGGVVPDNMEALVTLPGIGRYIASAVLCFGFGNAVSLIDTNTARIIQRYWSFSIRASRSREDKELWEFALRLVPQSNASAYNYALIDLGALVCKSLRPACDYCPLITECANAINNQGKARSAIKRTPASASTFPK